MKRHLDNSSSSGRRTKSSFDLLASVPAGKGLGMLPEESKQDVPYAQGRRVCREGEMGRKVGKKRGERRLLCDEGRLAWVSWGFTETRQGGG